LREILRKFLNLTNARIRNLPAPELIEPLYAYPCGLAHCRNMDGIAFKLAADVC
jgi:hypothetical protein